MTGRRKGLCNRWACLSQRVTETARERHIGISPLVGASLYAYGRSLVHCRVTLADNLTEVIR